MLMNFVRPRVATSVVVVASLWLLGWPEGRGVPTSSAQEAKSGSGPQIWTVPEIGALPNDADGRLVRGGRDLITATYAHIGPEVADRAKRFAGNNLACAIAISRPEPISSASRCSACSENFPTTTLAWGRR